MASGFSRAHAFAATDCVRCHRGDTDAATLPDAHRELIAFPGLLDNAQRSCGECHPEEVASVLRSPMSTGAGIVATTRRVFGEPERQDGTADLSHLGAGPADTLLRKQCASCHLGQPKREHTLNATTDRGGGCLACHVDHYTAGEHPALTAKVSDARCFGCHSRSGRISLSYAGLAEAAEGDQTHAPAATGYLEDARPVLARAADVHHAAGMGCIDCHTAADVMGLWQTEAAPVDIACTDCHANRAARVGPATWPERYRALLSKVPFPVHPDTRFLTTARNGTPLWNIELRTDGAWLHPKHGGSAIRIPEYAKAAHPLAQEHRRLHCSACHSQWAPQCYGCHLRYDPQGEQWDHAADKPTAGIWHERRSDIRSEPPPLGVTADEGIVPVVPGMIMTVQHPDWQEERLVRRFAPLEPHTTGPARSCESCHRSPTALGLGAGALRREGGGWVFEPAAPRLSDGLPADAWTRLDAQDGAASSDAVRPFSSAQIRRILEALEPAREPAR